MGSDFPRLKSSSAPLVAINWSIQFPTRLRQVANGLGELRSEKLMSAECQNFGKESRCGEILKGWMIREVQAAANGKSTHTRLQQ